MNPSNEQDQKRNPGTDTQAEDKKNLQTPGKSNVENSQSGGKMGDRSGKSSQNEGMDVDERTNAEQRGGNMPGSGQRQTSGQNNQQDQSSGRGVENSADNRQQQHKLDNDQDIDADKNDQGGRGSQQDRSGQGSGDSNKGSSQQTGGNKNSK